MSPTRTSSRRRPTITQVAAAAKVAPATVSSVLNGRADCYASKQTRQRVIQAARRLGYRPNPAARALLGKPTATLGLVVPALDVEVSSQKFVGFEAMAWQHEHVTILATTQNDPQREDTVIRWLLDRYVDGIAVYPTEEGQHTELRRLAAEGFPVVSFDGAGRLDFQTDDVSVDSFAGGRMQAQHLLAIGRRRIGIVNSLPDCHIVREKIRGIQSALADAGLPPAIRADLALPIYTQRHWETAELHQVGGFLDRHARQLDAIAAVGDVLAMTTIQAAVNRGLRVPGDLAVIGYDGLLMAEHTTLPLSTISHPSVRIGEMAFELLGDRLSGQASQSPRRVLVPPEIHVRASTLPADRSAGHAGRC